MDTKTKSMAVYRLVADCVRRAAAAEREAACKLAAEREGQRLFDADPDNAFARSPYRVESALAALTSREETTAQWRSILDHTVDTFLDGAKP